MGIGNAVVIDICVVCGMCIDLFVGWYPLVFKAFICEPASSPPRSLVVVLFCWPVWWVSYEKLVVLMLSNCLSDVSVSVSL